MHTRHTVKQNTHHDQYPYYMNYYNIYMYSLFTSAIQTTKYDLFRIWIGVPPTHGPISRKPREVIRFPDTLPPSSYGPFDIFLRREQRVSFQGFPGFLFEPGFSGRVTTGGQHEPLAEIPHQRVHLWSVLRSPSFSYYLCCESGQINFE